jgi:hypothetical protein
MRCWYTRWKMSSTIDDGGGAALEELARRGHAARCARCRAYASSLAALDARLERGARQPGVPAPAPLTTARPARPARWPVLAGCAALAAAGVALALRAGDPETAPPPDAPTAAVLPRTTPGPGLEPAPAPAAGALQQTAARVSRAAAVAGASLESELRALIDDGARGVGAVLTSSGLREYQ